MSSSMNSIRSLPMLVTLALAAAAIAGATPEDEQNVASGSSQKASPGWTLLESLEGTWEGEVDGKLGRGKGLRRYELALGDRFLFCRQQSIRPPQEKSPKGEIHEELGIFSFDQQRKSVVYREFLSEGVIARSPCEVEGNRVVCTSEAVENGPGIRVRLTLEITDSHHFTELYELGFAGREPEPYITVRWTRAPHPFTWD